jgi:hypothetical protein
VRFGNWLLAHNKFVHSVPVGYSGNFEGMFLDQQRGFELKKAKTAVEVAKLFLQAEDDRNPDVHDMYIYNDFGSYGSLEVCFHNAS